jgi:hypothetical protein
MPHHKLLQIILFAAVFVFIRSPCVELFGLWDAGLLAQNVEEIGLEWGGGLIGLVIG